jgi:hypothetical protein
MLENKIIVVAEIERIDPTHSLTNCDISRIRKLGLTAYGLTSQEADEKLSKMFKTYIALHRKYNTLEKTLKRSKLNWFYQNDTDKMHSTMLTNNEKFFLE